MKLAIIVLVFLALPTSAEIYQWRDQHGQLHFSDRAPENAAHVRKDLIPVSTYTPVIPDIKDESAARKARNQSRLESKKSQRLADEKARLLQADRQKKCRKARQDYRSGEGRYRSQPGLDDRSGEGRYNARPGLNDLKKARRRIDAINDRIKAFCY